MKRLRFVAALVFLFGSSAAVFAGQDAAGKDPAAKPAPARVTFVKQFPGSVPDYYSVAVRETGEAEYVTAPDDPQPLRFKMSEATTREIFQLTGRLNRFENAQLETRKKVAAMGKKTFRYEGPRGRFETSFNYSENADAMALAALFERVSWTEQHLTELERAARFDKLGVMKELLQIDSALSRKELLEAAQLVPLLEEIAGNSTYLHIAQQRARDLLQRIRSNEEVKAKN